MSYSPHPDPDHKPYVHPNLPVLTPFDLEKSGWRVPSIGETVKTYWRAYVLWPRPMWKISSYWTHEKLIHDGRTSYQVPVSIGAWLTVAWPLMKKFARGIRSGEAFGKKRVAK